MSDDTHTGVQPVSDDPELAKVLDGMNQQANTVEPPQDTAANSSGLQFEETATATSAAPEDDPVLPEPVDPNATSTAPVGAPSLDSQLQAPVTTGNPELDSIKKDALEELRPLVDKLDLPADEKFDTLLLIIRSTDDQNLVSAAYAAAKSIEDETKRAQALLDIIKEIDFFAHQS